MTNSTWNQIISVINRKTVYLLSAICIFVALFLILRTHIQPTGVILSTWQIQDGSTWQTVQLPVIQPLHTIPQTTILRTTLPMTEADALIIPRQSGNSIQVLLNDTQLYSVGDPSEPTANLWNYVHLIQLPHPITEPSVLEIRLSSSSFASGLNGFPYLTEYRLASHQVSLLNWLASDSLWMLAGAALALGILLFMLALTRGKNANAEFFTGICLLMSVIYVQDAVFRISSGTLTDFLWTKKIIMAAGYIGILCFLCAIEKFSYRHLRFSKWMLAPVIPAVIAVLTAPNFQWFDQIIHVTNLVMFVLLTSAVVLLFISQKSQPWMIFPTTLLLLSIVQMICAVPLKWTGPLFIYPAILFTISVFGFNLIFEFHKVFRENVILRKEKNLDPLTGALNRNSLNEVNPHFFHTLVMIDLDNFKEINDTYGHAFGDILLIDFVKILQKNLRHDDLIIRYGGDEFLLLLKRIQPDDTGKLDTERILQRIQSQYRLINTEIEPKFSYGLASVTESLHDSVSLADLRMYEMKHNKAPLI